MSYVNTQRLGLYGVWDCVARRLKCLHLATSDGLAVRNIIRGYGYEGENFQTSKVLYFGDFVFEIDPSSPVEDFFDVLSSESSVTFSSATVVPWTAWRDIENKAELLAPLGLSADETAEIVREKINEKVGE